MSKILKYYADFKHHEIPIEIRGSISLGVHQNVIRIKTGDFNQRVKGISRSYDFGNVIGTLTLLLMQQNKAVNLVVDSEKQQYSLEYRPHEGMKSFINQLYQLKEIKTPEKFVPLSLSSISSKYISSEGFLSNTINRELLMTISFYGHHVGGSYRHDYQAAADYLKVLKEKFPHLDFQWIDYELNNSHSYRFLLKIPITAKL